MTDSIASPPSRAGHDEGYPALVQVVDSIGPRRGGLTKAVLERFRMLSAGQRSILVTVAYQPDVRSQFNSMLKTGELPHGTELASFHECLRNTQLDGDRLPRVDHAWELDPSVERVQESTHVNRYFRAGKFLGLTSRRTNGVLAYVDVHSSEQPWKLLFRDRLWDSDSVGVRDYIDESGAVRYKVYLNRDGLPYLSTWVTPARHEYRSTLWTQYPRTVLKDIRDANALWLHNWLPELGSGTLFADEPRTSFAFAKRTAGIRTVATIHTTHRIRSHPSETLKGWVANYTRSIANIDALVALTKKQGDDIINDFPAPPGKVRVIPHPAPPVEGPSSSRDSNSIVVVSRLSSEKRIDDIIRAFASSLAPRRQMRLDIYGSGPERKKLVELAERCGVSSQVVFHGYTLNPLGAFSSAAFSLFASEFEGMGLVLLESLSAGTPVVGYNVAYGPFEIIRRPHSVPVADGDLDGFSAAISDLASSPSKVDEMRAMCRRFAGSFSYQSWKADWRAESQGPSSYSN